MVKSLIERLPIVGNEVRACLPSVVDAPVRSELNKSLLWAVTWISSKVVPVYESLKSMFEVDPRLVIIPDLVSSLNPTKLTVTLKGPPTLTEGKL